MKTSIPLRRRPRAALLPLLVAVCGVAGCEDDPLSPEDLIAEIREQTARFADPNAAATAGYASMDNNACVAVPGMGGMGMHFVNPALAGIAAPFNPNVSCQ